MRTEPFHRDHYYGSRLCAPATDPFDVRVFDYRLQRVLSFSEAEMLTGAVYERFDSLRTGIARDAAGELRACDTDGSAPPSEYIEVESVRLASATREQARCSSLRTIDLLGGRLATFTYFVSRAENATLFRIVCSHFAVDQTTHGLLARFVAAHVAGADRSGGNDPRYLDWMSAYHRYALSLAGQTEAKFWENYFESEFADLRSRVEGASRDSGVRAILTLSSAAAAALTEVGKTLRCRLADILASQTVRAIGKEHGLKRVPVTWTGHGRYPMGGYNFTRTPGWLGERHPLVVPIEGSSVEALTGGLRQALTSLPVWGNAFGWVSRFSADARLAERLASPFIFNIQESGGPPLRRFERGDVSFEPFVRAGVAPRIYIVIAIGASVKITLECAGGADPEACKRVAWHLAETLEASCDTIAA